MSAQQAITWARARVGTTENPSGSNKGPGITDWQVASGYLWVAGAFEGVPWCQCFANAVAVRGGAPQLRTGYTPSVLRGIGDFRPVAVEAARAGDFIFYKWPGVSRDPCDHVGVLVAKTSSTVTCVEGNTSSGNAGSQNNGGGIYLRTRARSLVAGAVRVPYASPTPCEWTRVVLRRGSTGAPVKQVQAWINCLRDAGFDYAHLATDGSFGVATEREVRTYQARHELEVDGVVGAKTWTALCRSAT